MRESAFNAIREIIANSKLENTVPISDDALWPICTPDYSELKVWAPKAKLVRLNLYKTGNGNSVVAEYNFKRTSSGVWVLKLMGDYYGMYYTIQTKYSDNYLPETPGIYAKAVGVNGKRAMFIDLNKTNPLGWHSQKQVANNIGDILLYELHVRDFTIDTEINSLYPGKYLGFTERNLSNAEGLSAGIQHIIDLGVTHVHLLPVFDHLSIDENRLDKPQFNWGYDPMNFNVPEGSFSTDPYKAEVRITEFKQMVMSLHNSGLGVIMDVVFNHTGATELSNFNLEVPGYYYRFTNKGEWSNASGCGNETASERFMMRKFMLDSCVYWVNEYKVDGFRFDLMGIHDIECMNYISEELCKIKPDIVLYGEGWCAGESPLKKNDRAIKENVKRLKNIAVFSDDIRDGIKGNVFHEKSKGFVNGADNMSETIKFGVVGSVNHPQIDYNKVLYSQKPWAAAPSQTIGYVSCHDNNTLFDKLCLSAAKKGFKNIKRMHCLANSIVLTSQSVPFLHAGVEMMRTKKGENNSYNLPDTINQLNWTRKSQYYEVFDYYRKLIAIRKAHSAFRMPTEQMVNRHLKFIPTFLDNVVAFQINENANNDTWQNIVVIYNASNLEYKRKIAAGIWTVVVEDLNVSLNGIRKVENNISVPSISMTIICQ